ncbi:MAG: 50S ribosomal protein L30 [Desulfovibrionales bacterium]|nr:50S ribosomal protein L30 [Desulfovibrionales bacterium]
MIRVKLIKSLITQPPAQRKTVKALGFTKLNEVVTLPDNDCIRGMIQKVKHLVEVVQ